MSVAHIASQFCTIILLTGDFGWWRLMSGMYVVYTGATAMDGMGLESTLAQLARSMGLSLKSAPRKLDLSSLFRGSTLFPAAVKESAVYRPEAYSRMLDSYYRYPGVVCLIKTQKVTRRWCRHAVEHARRSSRQHAHAS